MSLAETKPSKFAMFMMNPMVRKLDKVEESDSTHSTYGGITRKTLCLLLLTIGGAVIFFMTNSLAPTAYTYMIEGYEINMLEAAIVGGTLLLTAIGPWIAFRFVRTSMILGSLYSLAQGYALAFICHIVGKDYLYPVALAMLLTILIVAIMLVIYHLKLININKKFTSIIAILFFTSIISSILVYVAGMFPQTKFIYDMLMENSVIAISGGVIGIIIVSLFLLIDFEVIRHCVQDNLPKKYEWLAAFALSFSIIALFFKILNLILKITSKHES